MKMRLTRLAYLLVALIALALPSLAKPDIKPTEELKSTYQAGQKYVLSLEYRDPDGYSVESAIFHDSASGAITPYPAKSVSGNTENGLQLVWEMNGFAKGDHKSYFEVKNEKGTIVRYPSSDKENYVFVVESLMDKWIIMILGILICTLMLPFLVYIIARSANKQGNPSSAARIGLIIGIFAALALFIFLFVSWYSPLVLILGGIAAIFLLVVVITRR